MSTSAQALARIALVEHSYVRLARAVLDAVKSNELPAAGGLAAYVTILGQEIEAWKVSATALAYKSPSTAMDHANERLRSIHKTGEEFARQTNKANPAIDPRTVGAEAPASFLKTVAIVALVVLGVGFAAVVWRKVAS